MLICDWSEYVGIVYRSDPTENDSVEGLRPNARGPGLVTFGVSDKYTFMQGHCKFQSLFGPSYWSQETSTYLGVVLLQPDRVMEFCKNNDLQLIVRAHECVMDGFERFAQGHLITLFSATNYCGKYPVCRLQCLSWIHE